MNRILSVLGSIALGACMLFGLLATPTMAANYVTFDSLTSVFADSPIIADMATPTDVQLMAAVCLRTDEAALRSGGYCEQVTNLESMASPSDSDTLGACTKDWHPVGECRPEGTL